MKKLKDLNGIKILSKNEQNEINGGGYTYCKGNNMCCTRFASGFEFCDYGYCQSNGNCIWA
ncbi:hypothetical protein [Tenacibaculum sp.]|uniref:hypothetical protein n=1 Tax=Tenacibaculum sp. TaxID=1906242 RepID=UPI003D0DF224